MQTMFIKNTSLFLCFLLQILKFVVAIFLKSSPTQ